MSAGGGATTVTAHGGAHSVVAGTIHGGLGNNYYQVSSVAPPTDKFTYARRCLASGQATTARELMGEVVVHLGHSTRVWFHWLLAFFSQRTSSEFSAEEREVYAEALRRIDTLPRNQWSAGIDVIRGLVAAGDGSAEREAATTVDLLLELDLLDGAHRAGILRHLERVLLGSVKDELWQREVDQAADDQFTGHREERLWKFFEPDPARPRTRQVRPADDSAAGLALFLAAVATVAVGVLGWLALQRDDTSVLVALPTALLAAGLAVANGGAWRQATTVHGAARTRQARSSAGAVARSGGFTDRVDGFYRQYADKYAPGGAARVAWLIRVREPIARLRDELCEVYREQRSDADAVKWLVRFQVRELRRQWDTGALSEPRRRPVRLSVQVITVTGVMIAVLGVLWAAQAAGRQSLPQTAGTFLVFVAAGWVAAILGVRIGAENRRFAAEEALRQQRQTAAWFEFQRWERRLSDRPTDMEMGRWLDCDRRLLVQQALTAYQLQWSDIRAYASIEARAEGSRRARVKNGPWRYTSYKVLIFLLTADGVRQITVELNSVRAAARQWERTNYRYDAVAAVRVRPRGDANEFQLFLVNGTDIEVAVTESGQAAVDEDPGVLADAAKDATGLRNTLFVLEGVAAEGRSWWGGPAYRRAS
jgi:hypothetical protein